MMVDGCKKILTGTPPELILEELHKRKFHPVCIFEEYARRRPFFL